MYSIYYTSDWVTNHTLPEDIDFIYEMKEEVVTHQIFNLLDGELI